MRQGRKLLVSLITALIGVFFINSSGFGHFVIPFIIGIGLIVWSAYFGGWFHPISQFIPSLSKKLTEVKQTMTKQESKPLERIKEKTSEIPKPELNIQTGEIKSTLGSIWNGIATFLGWGDVQVDGWAAFVPERGKLATKLEKSVISTVKKRGLENMTVNTAELGIGTRLQALAGERRQHTVFKQQFGGGASSTLALRVAKRGKNDLEISWRLFENNAIKQAIGGSARGLLIIFGVLFTLMSLLLIPLFGAGLITLPIGLVIIGIGIAWSRITAGRARITTYQQFDSRVLLQTVDYSLMTTLEDEGVSKEELRVIVSAQSEGIGKLGP